MTSRDSLLAEIQARRARVEGALIVGVSGIEGAGKSTLARDLAQALNDAGVRTHVVCIDRFLNPAPLRHQGETLADAYYLNTFRFEDCAAQVLRPAKRDGALCGAMTVIDLETETLEPEPLDVPDLAVLIVEGVFLFRPPLVDLFDLTIWIEIDFDAALARATQRPDDLARYPDQDAIAARYTSRYFPAQRRHIEQDRPKQRADIVFDAH